MLRSFVSLFPLSNLRLLALPAPRRIKDVRPTVANAAHASPVFVSFCTVEWAPARSSCPQRCKLTVVNRCRRSSCFAVLYHYGRFCPLCDVRSQSAFVPSTRSAIRELALQQPQNPPGPTPFRALRAQQTLKNWLPSTGSEPSGGTRSQVCLLPQGATSAWHCPGPRTTRGLAPEGEIELVAHPGSILRSAKN